MSLRKSLDVPYFAAVFTRTAQSWTGREADLDEVESLEDVAEMLHDAVTGQQPALLLLEENDEWFAIVRVNGYGDPQVFLSDGRAPLSSGLAGMLHEEVESAGEDTEEEEQSRVLSGEPSGDTDILEDLGTGAEALLELTTEEGVLPADALSTVAENAGFAEELERLR